MEVTFIIRICRYGIMLLPVLLIFVAGICFFQVPNLEKKRTFSDRLKKVLKNIHLWILACVLYAACFAALTLLCDRVQNSITIGLNYALASRGLTPNSTRFNTYDIIDDSVLEQAISDGQFGDISTEDLRETLSVTPLQSGNDEEALAEEQYYTSTEYVLTYEASLKTLFFNGNDVVESVAQAFASQFYDQYSRKTDVLELDYTKVDDSDYLDKVDILSSQMSGIQDFLWQCNSQGENYVSEDGETFSSLATKVSNYQTVELERLRAYILTKGLSSDADRQLAKLEYENMIRDLNYQKNIADYNVLLETIDMYERDMATIVLVPTTDEVGEFYMSRTKIAVDDFADEAEISSQNAALAQNSIENNSYAISQLSSSEASDADYATADNMIASIKENMTAYADQALKMSVDFDSKTSGSYTVLTSDRDKFFGRLILREILLTGAMAVSCALVIMAFPAAENKKRGRKSEEDKSSMKGEAGR